MFNHLPEDAARLVPLLENPLGEDFYVLRTFEKAAKKPEEIAYVWQFPEGGWVSVLNNGAASISSVNDDNLQLSLAAMHAVSDIRLLNVPHKYAAQTKAFIEASGRVLEDRSWVTFLKKTPYKKVPLPAVQTFLMPATREHLEMVIQWQNRMFIENGAEIDMLAPEKQRQQLKEDIATGNVLIISNNVQPIGYVLRSYFTAEEGVQRTTLRNIYIDTPYRRSGVGRYIVQKLVQQAFEQGEGPFFLMTVSNQVHLLHFYESLGFERSAEITFFYLEGSDEH